jgi:hypothetical protein
VTETQINMKFLKGVQKPDMKISCCDFGIIPKDLEWICRNMQKTTILRHFLRIFEISSGGIGTVDHKSRKIHVVNILPTHQYGQLCIEEFFLSFSLFGRAKVVNYTFIQNLTRATYFEFKNCRVSTIINSTCAQCNFFHFSHHIYFYRW